MPSHPDNVKYNKLKKKKDFYEVIETDENNKNIHFVAIRFLNNLVWIRKKEDF